LKIEGLGFGVRGIGFRVRGSEFRVQVLGFRNTPQRQDVSGSGLELRGRRVETRCRNSVHPWLKQFVTIAASKKAGIERDHSASTLEGLEFLPQFFRLKLFSCTIPGQAGTRCCRRMRRASSSPRPTPCTLHPAPCTLHSEPYTLHSEPCTLHPTPYDLDPES